MSVMTFNSPEERDAYLRLAAEEAHIGMHLNQRAITFGDYWVRFIDIAYLDVEFGRVLTLQEVLDTEIEAGATAAEAVAAVDATEVSMGQHKMYGMAHSRTNRAGEYGYTHKAHVWPIDKSLFETAAHVGWQIEYLPVYGKISLEAAYRAMRGHVRNLT